MQIYLSVLRWLVLWPVAVALSLSTHGQTPRQEGRGRAESPGVREQPIASDDEQDGLGPAGEPPASQAAEPGRLRGRWPKGPHLAQRLFRQLPEDQGPLRPGEEDELLAFARQHMPRFYRVMEAAREHNPERFRRQLTEHAPRLRHLRRVFEFSPRIGEIIRTHAENQFKAQRQVRVLQLSAPDTPGYQQGLASLRGLVAENVRLESDALEAMAGVLEERRGVRIDERVAHLTSNDSDLKDEPEGLRRLVESYQAATADDEREQLRQQIRDAVGRQLDAEVSALRKRAAEMRAGAAEDVDRRMERILNAVTSRASLPRTDSPKQGQ